MILQKLIQNTAKRFKAARLHYGHGTGNARDEAAFLVIRGLGLPFDVDLATDVPEEKVEKLIQLFNFSTDETQEVMNYPVRWGSVSYGQPD